MLSFQKEKKVCSYSATLDAQFSLQLEYVLFVFLKKFLKVCMLMRKNSDCGKADVVLLCFSNRIDISTCS
jgi:hypothetical protein